MMSQQGSVDGQNGGAQPGSSAAASLPTSGSSPAVPATGNGQADATGGMTPPASFPTFQGNASSSSGLGSSVFPQVPPPPPGFGQQMQASGAQAQSVGPQTPVMGAAVPTVDGTVPVGTVQNEQTGRADRWVAPLEKVKAWKTRSDELIGFSTFIVYVANWLGAMSDQFPAEVYAAAAHRTPLTQALLTPAQAARSVRSQVVLTQAFADNPRGMRIITAYVESSQFAVCGFETLTKLAEEFIHPEVKIGRTFLQKSAVDANVS